MSHLLTLFGLAILTVVSLVACADFTGKVDTALASPVTQQDVKWGCMALRGGSAIYAGYQAGRGVDVTAEPLFKRANDALNTTCEAAIQGKLASFDDAYKLVMDLAGQIAASTP